jgi:alkylation response protein AidB-like acyl-CoA dehydrogenase
MEARPGGGRERERRETRILPAWAHGECSREGVRIFVDNERRMRRRWEARGRRKGRGEEGWWEKEWDVSKDLSLCGWIDMDVPEQRSLLPKRQVERMPRQEVQKRACISSTAFLPVPVSTY